MTTKGTLYTVRHADNTESAGLMAEEVVDEINARYLTGLTVEEVRLLELVPRSCLNGDGWRITPIR